MPDKNKSIKVIFDEQLLKEIVEAVLEFEEEMFTEDGSSNDIKSSKDMQVLNKRGR